MAVFDSANSSEQQFLLGLVPHEEGALVARSCPTDRAQLPLGALIFIMRAFKTTSPTGHVHWAALNAPDPTAKLSPVAPGDLSDIVIAGVFDPDVERF